MKKIRNFCIIAHIDHGKSTLADRLLEATNTLNQREMQSQVLDDMDLEREKGITIKSHAIQMNYVARDGEQYTLNLIDTPGHVDFSYEVSRAIASCEGALLVVDATQGIQAQTISNLYLAFGNDLEIIPVLNKIDMPSAMIDEVKDQIVDLLGCDHDDILCASGKTGEGVEEVLEAIVSRVPAPKGDENAPLQALIFDSVFNPFRGIIAYFRIFNGSIRKGEHVKFFNTGEEYDADEIGVLKLKRQPCAELKAGNVGYICSGIKDSKDVKVGDTITSVAKPCTEAIAGFEDVKPMVFAGVEVKDQIVDLLGCDHDDILCASGKTGEGVEEVLEAIVSRVPAPKGDENAPLQALIFDSVFNPFRGIIAYFRIFNGSIRKGEHVKFFNTGEEYDADEIGVLKLKRQPCAELKAGNVGYICSGIKDSKDVKVGDTITSVAKPCTEAIAGFEDVKPMVFAGVYPVEADQYEDLRASLEKLQLNDASLTFEPESSLALGFGFRCGFLGLLHMEIIQERLYREFDMDVITTVPNVSYKITTTMGDVVEVHNPSGLPEVTKIEKIEEPYILAQIITKADFLGPVMKLCIDKRGVLKNQTYITQDRVEVNFEMPLSEIVFDFYDKLKSISKGYASFDYHRTGYEVSKLAKLDILLNGDPVDALSSLIYADHAYDFGRKMCEKLKELIPRQQFDIAIQAAIGAKIIARETVKAVRKDVTAKCYGGDISRKRKLLEKQKAGKKRMRQIGQVQVPQTAFLAVLKMD